MTYPRPYPQLQPRPQLPTEYQASGGALLNQMLMICLQRLSVTRAPQRHFSVHISKVKFSGGRQSNVSMTADQSTALLATVEFVMETFD